MERVKSEACILWSNTCYSANKAWQSFKKLDIQHDKPPKVPTRTRQWIAPILLASMLFLSWGLAYGLLDIMNYHVMVAMNLRREQTALLAASYYAAYIPGALLIGGPIVKTYGYRPAMVLGLLILAVGDFLMSVGASKCSLAGMVASHFVIGLGVSTLERAANPYATNCGLRDTANLRILIAQGFAALGTVIAPPIANGLVFDPTKTNIVPTPNPLSPGRCLLSSSNVGSCANLGTVITFYRGIGLIILAYTTIFALLAFRTPLLPELPVPQSPPTTHPWYKPWLHPLCRTPSHLRIWLGVAANFFNLGCQVTFAQFFVEHIKTNACQTERMAANYMSVAQALFVVGRFTAALFALKPRVFKPRYILLIFLAGAVATTGAGTSVYGTTAIVLALLVMFFEAPSFPMIFESATAGYEEWAPTCETLMIVSISGGGLQPAVVGKVADKVGVSMGWIVTTSAFGVVFGYAVLLNLVPSFRKVLDQAEMVEVWDRAVAMEDPRRNGQV